jgi:hypothetical protein
MTSDSSVPTDASPKKVSGSPLPAATMSSSLRPSSAETVAPDVRTACKLAPPEAMNVEPANGAGLVSEPDASPVLSLALAAATDVLPPGVVNWNAKRLYARVMLASHRTL